MKHTKFIVLAGTAVLFFTAGSVVFSCVQHGKTVSVNTGYDADGTVHSCILFSRVTKVIAIDGKNRSVRKELPAGSWEYDRDTGRFTVLSKAPADMHTPIFHIEGSAVQPRTFMLSRYDPERGPAAVFFNGRQAVENRDYTLDRQTGKLVVSSLVKNADSYSIVWETPDGMSSTGEMTGSERDTYSELQAAWLADIERRDIQAETDIPDLDLTGGTPVVVLRPVTPQEKQAMLDAIPVYVVKDRTKTSRRALSKETGIRLTLPSAVTVTGETYSCVSTLLIDSAVRGIRTLSVEKTYSQDVPGSRSTFIVSVSGTPDTESAQWPVKTDQLSYAVPVKKQTAWNIISGTDRKTYRAGLVCTYIWQHTGVWYKIETEPENTAQAEQFIQEIVRHTGA